MEKSLINCFVLFDNDSKICCFVDKSDYNTAHADNYFEYNFLHGYFIIVF